MAAAREPDLTFGVFADLNGGSTLEVILSGVGKEELSRQIYRYDAAERRLIPWSVDPLPEGNVTLVEDLDQDGHVDALLVTGDGMRVRLGDASGLFQEYSLLASETGAGHYQRTIFHLADLDSDGWLDVLMADECSLITMLRTGPRTWSHRQEALQGFQSSDPYAIAVWPQIDRPSPILALGQPTCGFYSAFESLEEDDDGYPLYEPVQVFEGLSASVTVNGSTGLASMAPMGSASADLNRDGALDLFVTLDPMHAILDGAASWPVAT